MSALGQKQTSNCRPLMSALPPKAARRRRLPVVLDGDRRTVENDLLFRLATHVIFSSECLRETKASSPNGQFAQCFSGKSLFSVSLGRPIYSRGPVPTNTEGNMPMSWTTPTLVEVCIGLEINGYLPPEF
jgi:coenzyme PQQ precursor peptide PqqA